MAYYGKDPCNLEKDPPCLRRWLSTRINGSQIIIKDHFPRITPPTESCVNTTIIITVGHCLLSTGEHMTPSSASAGCFAEGTTLEGGKRRVCPSVCLTGGGVCREEGRGGGKPAPRIIDPLGERSKTTEGEGRGRPTNQQPQETLCQPRPRPPARIESRLARARDESKCKRVL